MSSLESLSNPLERLVTLPTAVQARPSAAGDIVWDAGIQYFQNDLVLSSVDGGAYIFTGGASSRTSILGGTDPALTPLLWTRLQGDGLTSVDRNVAVADIVGAANAYTLPAGFTLANCPAGSLWNVVIQGRQSTVAATVAGTVSRFQIAGGGGAGATTAIADVVPIVDTVTLATNFGLSCVVSVGAGGGSITPTATYLGAVVPTLSGTAAANPLTITYTRIA